MTTRLDIRLRRQLANGASFGDVGPYEELKGRLYFAIDPSSPANARITDIALAPRNAAGRVEFNSDVSILVPLDRAKCTGPALIDVVNRGNTVSVPNFNRAPRPVFTAGSDADPPIDVGDGFLMKRGYVVTSCGWQCDLPRLPGLYGMEAPEALDATGQRLRGRVYTQLQTSRAVTHLLLSDRGHRPYPAARLDEPGAVMTVRDAADATPTVIPRARWRFARLEDGRVVSDGSFVWLEGGFEKGRLYHVSYTAIGALVVGLGPTALRECAAWLKHGGTETGNPAPGRVRHAYAYGRSQTGRLLRTLAYDDLNLDESGREGLDGFIANVAGGMRGEFNQRFGQNSKDRPHVMAHLFPSTDLPEMDKDTGATDALHRRIDERGSSLKTIYTNTSAEYHRGDASLIHTDPGGERDVAHGARTRIYHFAGTEHGTGVWPPSDSVLVAADPVGGVERSQNLRGTIDYAPLLRACLVNLDRWVVDGVEPPPSRHPRIANGTAVNPDDLAKIFPGIPASHYPARHACPQRLDFGPDPQHALVAPPGVGRAFGTWVAAVDADGNEVGGVIAPEVSVPLATHTGWNLRHPDIGGESQLLIFAGSTIPFPRTRAEREASGDPRLSIEERYKSREDYLGRVRQAAIALARERYLLEEDIAVSVSLAARMWDWLVTGGAKGEDGVRSARSQASV